MHMAADDTDQLIREARAYPLFRAAIEAILVARHAGLVLTVLRRLKLPDREDMPDLVQEGQFALVRAIRGYDPDRGYAWSSYACRAIYQALSRYLDQRHRKGMAAQATDPAAMAEVAGAPARDIGLPEWATAKLTVGQADVVHARGVLGLSYAAIDVRLGMPAGSAARMWRDVVQVLRDAAPVLAG